MTGSASMPMASPEATATNSNFLHKPWQVDWKRPIWQHVQSTPESSLSTTHAEDEEEPTSSTIKRRRIATCHVAASVLAEEIREFVTLESDQQDSSSFGFLSSHTDEDDNTVSYLLTVTLLKTQIVPKKPLQHHHKNWKSPALADVVLLEIVEQRQKQTSSFSSLASTSLRRRRSNASASGHHPTGSGSMKAAAIATIFEAEESSQYDTGRKHSTNSPNIVTKCLQSRLLRWPAATLSSHWIDEDEQEETEENIHEVQPWSIDNGINMESFSRQNCFHIFPFQSRNLQSLLRGFCRPMQSIAENDYHGKTRTKKKKKPLSLVGLVGATLVRLPPHYDNIDKGESSAADALDVVQFMSMFGHHSDPASANKSTSKPSDKQQEPLNGISEHDKTKLRTKQSVMELRLALLSSDGKIYLYSPWSLLHKKKKSEECDISMSSSLSSHTTKEQQRQHEHSEDNKKKNELMTNSMAALLLGRTLLAAADDSLLPLNQPLHIVRLSVPFLLRRWTDRKTRNRNERTPHSTISPQSHTTASPPINIASEGKSSRPKGVSVWDPSVWDVTVDNATLPYQTENNIPTHCVGAYDYLVIAGRGKQRWANNHDTTIPDSVDELLSNTTFQDNPILPHDNHIQQSRTGVETGAFGKVDSTAAPGEKEEAGFSAQDEFTVKESNNADDGGFITFVSLRNFVEARTLFLPFVPDQISPFTWLGLSFVFVAGHNGSRQQAVAIRVDSAVGAKLVRDERADTVLNDNEISSNGDLLFRDENVKLAESTILIDRFQILPIDLPGAESSLHLFGSESSTSPPVIACIFQDKPTGKISVVHRTLSGVCFMPRSTLKTSVELFVQYGFHLDQLAIIQSRQAPGQVVSNYDVSSPSRYSMKHNTAELGVWCHTGQGYCLVGSDENKVSFLCFEGASSEREAFVHELSSGGNSSGYIRGLPSAVLPLDPFAVRRYKQGQGGCHVFNMAQSKTVSNVDVKLNERDSDSELMDQIIADAMESISSFNYREQVAGHAPFTSPRRKSHAYTPREKSQRLLRHCPNWSALGSMSRYELQLPMVSVRISGGHANDSEQFILSLRKIMAINGPASPFHLVLPWLAAQGDYFTASSLALDLLHDTESLAHLWMVFNKIDDEDERSKLDGLLDGVLPVRVTDLVDKDVYQSTLTHLADMTVGCLAKGGYFMASTLEQFLGRNLNYDASRASLVLVAIAACTLSDDEELVASAMGSDYQRRDFIYHAESALWPVRCLLKVGVTRDFLLTALLLLNSTIPDELRRHQRGGSASLSIPSLDICKSLVTLIVASAPEAAGILLDLLDEKTHSRFWQSLHHETQLELSLISIDGRCPLLREPEIRAWALIELQKSIESEKSASSSSGFDTLPSQWLSIFVSACMTNAGCVVRSLFELEQLDEKYGDEDGLEKHAHIVHSTRMALVPAPGMGGLDFDLVIPSLLILEHRHVIWDRDAKISTREVLNAACYLAGRRNVEEPLFALDSATLMRQCTLVDDVEAGANLIGGKNGLILECCHILIESLDMTMDNAEKFLLSEQLIINVLGEVEVEDGFVIQSYHRHTLELLEKHVLRIRTFGEFETKHIRGRVDPVFAATLSLRTWWAITRSHIPEATQWLTRWLRKRLSIYEDAQKVSPHRLACAALVRALIWTGSEPDSDEMLLASRLEIDGRFLVQLSQPCCGLVESLPNYVAEEALLMAEKENRNIEQTRNTT